MRELIEIAVRELRDGNAALFRRATRDLLRRRPQAPRARKLHLDAAIQWLCRAQDASGTGGVARSYGIAWSSFFRTRGWLPPYPETTGYIIPTMLAYAALTRDGELRQRALRMADWEIEVQLPSGAVQGGVIGMPVAPAIFNTGQVIFGWLASHRETADERYLAAATRAGRFLVENQDDDGIWRRALSPYSKPGPHTYNARTAWALVGLAETTGDASFRLAAIRNLDACLRKQAENGWFAENCLSDDRAPLTHTIAYTAEGMLGAGRLLGEPRFVDSAKRVADALIARQRSDGSLAGRYDANWTPAVRWSCLTGDAQMAIVWVRLSRLLHEPHYLQAASRMLDFICSVQDLDAEDPGVRGGIAGAYPIYGDYGRLEYLNWAAKFFADAMMEEAECR